MAAVEFWRQGGGLIVSIDDVPGVPMVGSFVNIKGKTWFVADVTWAVDAGVRRDVLRANVELREPTDQDLKGN